MLGWADLHEEKLLRQMRSDVEVQRQFLTVKMQLDIENEKAKRFVNDLKEMPYSHLIKLTNIKIDYEYDVQGQARIVCYKKHD